MSGILLLGLLAAGSTLPVRVISLAEASLGKPISVALPAGKTTRLVFPERSVSTVLVSGSSEDLGLQGERSRPLAAVTFTPRAVDLRGTLEFQGPSRRLKLELHSVALGEGYEARFVVVEPTPTTPVRSAELVKTPASPGTRPASIASPTPSPSPTALLPSASPRVSEASPAPHVTTMASSPAPPAVAPSTRPAAVVDFDQVGFMKANPVVVDRREAPPGHPEMVLRSVHEGEDKVWLRLQLKGGAEKHVGLVRWERGRLKNRPATWRSTVDVSAFTEQTLGKDLLIVVQLAPASDVTKQTRVIARIAGGGEYKFALNSGTFSAFLKSHVF
jgi:hypothetical protein